MQVISATDQDIPQLCELLTLLFSQEVEFSARPAAQARGLKAILDSPTTGRVLILKEETIIIGMVVLLFTVSTYLGAKVALLEDMIVDPKFRGKGAGTLLLCSALQVASEEGCRRVTLLTDSGNQRAHAFYAQSGFTRSTMVPFRMHLSINDE